MEAATAAFSVGLAERAVRVANLAVMAEASAARAAARRAAAAREAMAAMARSRLGYKSRR